MQTFHIFGLSIPVHTAGIGDWILIAALSASVVLTVVHFLIYRGYLTRTIAKGKQKLSFTDWTGILTTAGTLLSIILSIQMNQTFTSLSLVSGIVIISAPLVYIALFPRNAFIWFFLIMTTITLVAVLAELIAAFLLVGNIMGLFPWEIDIIQTLVGVIFLMAILYDVRTTYQLIHEAYPSFTVRLLEKLTLPLNGVPTEVNPGDQHVGADQAHKQAPSSPAGV